LLERPEGVAEPSGARERSDEGLVLVVDDDDELTRRVSADLTQGGLSVIATASASEGAALAAARRPDVIVLDLLLPDRGGVDLLATLKRDPATRHIPVLTVSDGAEGAVEIGDLVAEVRRHLGDGGRAQQASL
jgi:CheY-like chemotaxis protein